MKDYLYENYLRGIIFKMFSDAEKAHDASLLALSLFSKCRPFVSLLEKFNLHNLNIPAQKPIELCGLKFPNIVGLASGFDKQCRCWTALGALGFGHVEIGTITYLSQSGNERPRLFRYPKFDASVNSFGFPNDGAEIITKRIKNALPKNKRSFPLGINIGKSKACPIENATEDYLKSFRLLAPQADFVTINISSPNTPNLRKLHDKTYLTELLGTLQSENNTTAQKRGEKPLPIFLKIAPDLTYLQVDEILEVVQDLGISGIVATNTTVERPDYMGDVVKKGGLSGAPLMRRSLDMVRYIVRATDEKLPVIGCGGICQPEDADRFLAVGASMIQVYTGMVFRGAFWGRTLGQAYAWSQTDWPMKN